MLRTKRGFTLIEILIAMTISSMIMVSMGSVFYYLLVVPPRESDRLTATNDLRLALDRIQYDGVQALNFTPGSDPDYGYFSWIDYPSLNDHTVAYSYDNGKLIREESIEGGDTTTIAFARHVADYGDIDFVDGGNNTVIVTMTATMNPGTGSAISETETRYIEMRAWEGGS